MLPLTRVPGHHHHGLLPCLLITTRQNDQIVPRLPSLDAHGSRASQEVRALPIPASLGTSV